ncbi:MAG: hypothetical protein BWK73_21590, partial [Thiothrix lacustris]
SITLTAVDADTDAKLLTYKLGLNPQKGTLSPLSPGSNRWVYTPQANFSGDDSFYFKVSDGKFVSKTAKISITVKPVNDAPVVPSVTTLSLAEDTSKSLTLSGTDIEGDKLNYGIRTQPEYGKAVINGTSVAYTPVPNFFGTDSFTYTAFDGKDHSVAGRISVTVTSVNDAPVAQPQTVTFPAGVTSTITLQGTDVDSSKLSYQLANSPKPNGTLGAITNNQVTYTPKAGVSTDSFGFTVSDGAITSTPALVTVRIQALASITDPHLLRCFENSQLTVAEQQALTTLSCNKGVDLSKADLAQLTRLPNLRTLDLSHTSLTSISALAGLTQLTSLDLSSNNINSISPLSGMKQLRTLNLGFNDISDISILSNMSNVQELYLDANKISSIAALSNKTALLKLYLDDNQITSIAALAPLVNLTHLGLSYNQLNSISALLNLKKLQVLALEANNLSNVSALAGLTNLQALYARGNQLTDVGALTQLVNVTVLDLGFNKIANITPLRSMVKLLQLGLGFNNLTEVNGLASLTKLQSLDLENNQLNTLNGIQSLSALNGLLRLDHNLLLDEDILLLNAMNNNYTLRLEDNCLSNIMLPENITVYGKFSQFSASRCGGTAPVAIGKTVEIYANTITNITLDAYDPNEKPITFQLESVAVEGGVLSANVGKLANNQVTFFPNPDYLKSAGSFTFSVTNSQGKKSQSVTVKLRVIHPILEVCFGTSIPSDEALLTLQPLVCDNKGGKVTDISALPIFLPNLTHLSLAGNTISDYSSLMNLPKLTSLSLKGNNLDTAALQVIAKLSKLSILNLEQSQLNDADIAALSGLTNLTQLYLGGNQITNVSPLRYLTRLDVLTLDNNRIRDITPLATLTNIRTLNLNTNNLNQNQLLNLKVISTIKGLNYFEFDNNGLTSINGLENLTQLGVLTVRYNRLVTANALKALRQPMTLHLQGNCLAGAALSGWPSNISLIGNTSSNQRTLMNGQCPVYQP